MTTGYHAPSGPSWVKDAEPDFTVVTDGRGERWMAHRVAAGGREITWRSLRDGRTARTVATESHPDYPSDEWVEVLRKQARAAAKRPLW